MHLPARHLLAAGVLIVGALGAAIWGLTQTGSRTDRNKRVSAAAPQNPLGLASARRQDIPSSIRLTDVFAESSIDFDYFGGPSAQHAMTEQNGGGVALLDFDGDDHLDLFFVNGSHFDDAAEERGASNRLYRSVGAFQYEDVTEQSGLEAFGFGMGCAVGDYDNDGFSDLYVTYFGRNRLWRNNGDGTYDDVTDESGVGDETWGTGAAFADLDGDGDVEIYVVNYVDWHEDDPACLSAHERPFPISCSPSSQAGQADLLYRNLGDGRFEEVGRSAGIALAEDGKGLAVAIADFDRDGRLDIYVANDTTRNFLFRNLGQLQFREEGILKGVAVSADGTLGSSMGIACADYNRNGWLDLCVTNFLQQVNDVYSNLGETGFRPTNAHLGVDLVSRPSLSFGVVFADFDLDGWPDLFVANGHIWDFRSLGDRYEYAMKPHLLKNDAARRFHNVSKQTGDYFARRWLGRAVASGDLDNDGAADLVVTHVSGAPALLRNDSRPLGGSLRLKLIGRTSARQPRGTRVEVMVAETLHVTHIPSGGSFQASSDARVLIATGSLTAVPLVRVHWPGGRVETWRQVAVGGTVTLVEGSGETQ